MATRTNAKQNRRALADAIASTTDPQERAELKAEFNRSQEDLLAAALARNGKPQAAKPEPAETDQAEREAAKPVPQPKVEEPKAETPKATTPKVKEQRSCGCGCGGSTASRFVPGHDARLHGRIKRHLEGRLTTTDLTPDELRAVDEAIANGHIPGGSFSVQDHKSGATTTQSQTERKAERIRARIARLELELAQAKGELAELGHTPDEAVAPSDHTEIIEAMAAENAA